MNVDSKAGVIADGFYCANEVATIINHSQRIHTLFKSLLNSGTDATNVGRAVALSGVTGMHCWLLLMGVG
jgi:hypothetical protein